jgi:hypothetical protein
MAVAISSYEFLAQMATGLEMHLRLGIIFLDETSFGSRRSESFSTNKV